MFFVFSGLRGFWALWSLCAPWEALRNKNLAIQTRLRGWYQVRFFGLIFGHSWGKRYRSKVAPGTVPLRNPKFLKALHERHVWKTLKQASVLEVLKNLFMPLFLMGCFPVDFQEVKRPLRTKSVKSPTKVGKRPINEGETAH